ncbi:type II toxin-antitoxin system antitoxin SocA domain-containing protein [Methanobrevibacter sp. YE315]|uniref:type II toxin-antitoxin system antitoxin SocA domain-containing protein n=1 Tax=Methanobrevibacter sp. YE315 TaxID=1609968 RepID=UPI00082B6D81|nr:type II toxin-antitoxin system antitoxin SocA domain-containing protein [Methanobrevibacter sp. YE315]
MQEKYYHQPSQANTMKFNREKYADLIMYILSQTYNRPNLGKTVLCSILYFIDFNYYELYGTLLTKETYIKSKKGIKPKHFHEVTSELISKKQLFLRKEPYYHRTIHKYYLTIIPTFKFSRKELEIIDFSIERLSGNNASTIIKYAIKDPPLIIADFGENIDYRYVFSRNNQYSMKKIKPINK